MWATLSLKRPQRYHRLNRAVDRGQYYCVPAATSLGIERCKRTFLAAQVGRIFVGGTVIVPGRVPARLRLLRIPASVAARVFAGMTVR